MPELEIGARETENAIGNGFPNGYSSQVWQLNFIAAYLFKLFIVVNKILMYSRNTAAALQSIFGVELMFYHCKRIIAREEAKGNFQVLS